MDKWWVQQDCPEGWFSYKFGNSRINNSSFAGKWKSSLRIELGLHFTYLDNQLFFTVINIFYLIFQQGVYILWSCLMISSFILFIGEKIQWKIFMERRRKRIAMMRIPYYARLFRSWYDNMLYLLYFNIMRIKWRNQKHILYHFSINMNRLTVR